MKTLFFCLFAVLLLRVADVGRACEYCRMAAEDPEAARLALAAHAASAVPTTPGGAFPLQGALNQYKADAPAPVLTAPPATVATSAADLPTRLPVAPRPVVPAAGAVLPVATASVAPVAPHPAAPAVRSARWADAGLLGVFGLLGFFGWRTRANAAPRSER